MRHAGLEVVVIVFASLFCVACARQSGPKVTISQEPDTLSITSMDGVFMVFSGSSQETRPDWIFKLDADTLIAGHQGMNEYNYGGGIPCAVVWTKDECIAVGSLSPEPIDISIPVQRQGDTVRIWIEAGAEEVGDVFLYRGRGDCFEALRLYSEYLYREIGARPGQTSPSALQTEWCGWGYGATFTPEEILATIPKVKEMGIEWMCVDDGFQTTRGGADDWVPSRWPRGTMRNLADSIHSAGLKAMVWWYPLAAAPESKFISMNPQAAAYGPDGAPLLLGHGTAYAYPTDSSFLADARKTVRMFLEDWDYDGIKLDGHHLNCFPASAHVAHDPYYDARHLPDYYKAIFEEAISIKPDCVVQYCPCGCVFSIYQLPYVNQTVSSDPTSPWQVRSKAYVLKAVAPSIPYYGDHVELIGDDWFSQIAVGAVLGTKFTWPADNPDMAAAGGQSPILTPAKEEEWKKAFSIYNTERPSEGELLGGLYNLGFDYPEAYAIKKSDGTMFYSFFAPDYAGEVELRGLDKDSRYSAVNLWNGEKLGLVERGQNTLNLNFERAILIKLKKIE